MDSAVDFADLIEEASSRYLSRPAIETELDQRLNITETGILVLLAEPGAGKTCLAAAQIKSRNCLHHFLRRGHTESSLWRDPYVFLTSIGFQLRDRYGEDLFPSSVVIDVDQNVHILEETGSATGIQIQRLVSVPWRDATLRVRQVIGDQKGEIAGVEIGEMVDDYRHIPLLAFREMALLAPLRRLKKLKPEERVVLWVDALDEEPAGADSYNETISAMLPTPQELETLGNLWVVISSRPTLLLDRLLQSESAQLNFSDPKFAADNQLLIQQVVEAAVNRQGVKSAIQAAGQSPADIASLVETRSQGNLLYLDQFFRAAEVNGLPALLSGGLPEGLQAIQVRLLSALAEQAGAGFLSQVHPILQILAAAKEPLSAAQLNKFTGLPVEQVNAGISRLLPYLDPYGSGKSVCYSLYQRSFQETLTSSEHQASPWYVSLPAAHDRLSAFYLPAGKLKTQELDDYGLDYLTAHLAEGSRESQAQLLALLGGDWRRLRRRTSRSNWPFVDDLKKAVHAVQAMPLERAVPAGACLAMMGAVIHDVERWLPDGALKSMTRLGMLQRAFGAVSPEMSVSDQAARLTEIAAGLAAQARDEQALPAIFYQVLRQAVELLLREPAGFSLAQLLEACPIEDSADMEAFLQDVYQIIIRLPAGWERPRAVIEYARLFSGVNPEQARGWFQTALDDCLQNLRSSLTMEQARLMQYWAAFDVQAAADALGKMQLYRDEYSVRTVLMLGRALEQAGQSGALQDLLSQAEGGLMQGLEDVYKLALCRVELGGAYIEVGDTAAAETGLKLALQAAQVIGSEADKEKLSNRMQMATDAWVAVAGLAAALQAPEALDHLEQAWKLFSQHGHFNSGSIMQLVKLQLAVEPGLVEVYLGEITSPERKASALLHAVNALLDTQSNVDLALVNRWMDQALEHYEHSIDIAFPGRLYFAAACAFPPDQYPAADELIRSHLDAEELVAFRMDAARRNSKKNIPSGDILMQAVEAWNSGVVNENYFAELPAALADLPAEWVLPLVDIHSSIQNATKQFYLDCALSARLEQANPGSGRPVFEQALANLDQAVTNRTTAAELQAFAAGQWWDLDPSMASSLWLQALVWLNSVEAFQQDLTTFHYWLVQLLEALEDRQPGVAAQHYLASPTPPPTQGTVYLTVPGVLVDVFDLAGVEDRDVHLGRLVGGALAAGESWAKAFANKLLPLPARSVALSHAANLGGSSARRMIWADQAVEDAAGVEPDHHRWLLYAEGVHALTLLGAHQKAADYARHGVEMVFQSLPVFGTQPSTAYAHAMGRFLAAQAAAGEAGNAVYNLFGCRQLGSIGLVIALSGMCQQLANSGSSAALLDLLDQVETARKLI